MFETPFDIDRSFPLDFHKVSVIYLNDLLYKISMVKTRQDKSKNLSIWKPHDYFIEFFLHNSDKQVDYSNWDRYHDEYIDLLGFVVVVSSLSGITLHRVDSLHYGGCTS